MLRKSLIALVALAATAAAPIHAQPAAETASSSFSSARLAAISEKVRADVETGRIPGAVMLIARNGKVVYSDAIGTRDPATGKPMREDTIFRIYSMTKPIVSVATMMLVEEGKIQLDDPVSKYIPDLRDLAVGVEKTDASGNQTLERVPAEREMTVQDLLRHTSGLTYGVFGKSLVKSEYLKAGIYRSDLTNAEFAQKLSEVPLQFQPGTVWEYSRSTDVLGHLLERATGQSLDTLLEERLFQPLGMKDTGFWVQPDKQARIAEPFPKDPDTGAEVRLSNIREPATLLSGGGGLVSTAPDYLRFSQMLLNGGELDGVRILSPKTVAYMTSDHLGDLREASVQRGAAYLPGPGYSFGLGFAVRTAQGQSPVPGSIGDYNWGGYGGTYFWADPQENMTAIWMMQAPGQRTHYRTLYRDMVYGAMTH